MIVEMDDEITDYDPEDLMWTLKVQYSVFDRSSRGEVKFRDLREVKPEEIEKVLRNSGFDLTEEAWRKKRIEAWR